MKVRAVAVAAEQSNAIGTLELECTPHGLVVAYLGVGSFTEGYAPGALTTGTRVTVPWWAIDTARVERDFLYLELDAKFTPHSRLTLSSFSSGEAQHPSELDRQRTITRITAAAAAAIAVLLIGVLLPKVAPRATTASALGIAVAAAAVIAFVGLLADRRLTPGVDGEAARELFVFDLGNYLPAIVRSESSPRPPPKPITLPVFQGLLPRTTFAIVLTLSACGLGAVLMGKWVLAGGRDVRERQRIQALEEREREMPPVQLAPPPSPQPTVPLPAAAAPAAPEPSSAATHVASTHGTCRCERGDSSLWREPIPKLSTIVIGSRAETRRSRPELQVEIAAVNNSDQQYRDVEIQIDFFERDPPPAQKRHWVSHRVVFFAGPLLPGQAIKWSVEAEGTEFEIKNPIEGDIGPGGDGAAPISRFAELLDANHRPVRLHGAMMLAYLGDPRAKEAAFKLRDALREDEGPYLSRILQAVSDVRACQLDLDGHGAQRRIQVCAFNGSAEAKRDLAVRVNAFDGRVSHAHPTATPPLLVGDATLRVPGELAPGTGAVLSGTIDLSRASSPPVEFEAAADRVDLLQ
jgi:hypothetical protein